MIDDKQLSIFTNLTLISLKHYFDSKALKAIEEQERIRLQEEKEKQVSVKKMSAKQKAALIEQLTEEMKFAAGALEFERAAYLRDQIAKISFK